MSSRSYIITAICLTLLILGLTYLKFDGLAITCAVFLGIHVLNYE